MTGRPLDRVASIKVKLGLLVAVSATVAAVVAMLGRGGGVPIWLGIPVTIGLALAVTQLLAVGMVSPLREMTAAARRMATGDYAVRVSATSTDEVGELARAFNTMAGDLNQVDRERRELVAGVSHELRTPLTGLRAVLENAVDGVGPPDTETLTTALSQAERLSDLVEDLLDLARVDAGQAPLRREDVAIDALVAGVVEEAKTLGRSVTFDVRVVPADLVVQADPGRLHQLLANVVDNATRHSPSGGTVRITVSSNDDGYRLEIEDDGPGVDPADRDRAFERFRTLGSDDAGGTGLGLAIARWVTDLHGGSIRFVDPTPEHSGARVRVDLPLSPPARSSVPQEDDVKPSPVTTDVTPTVVPARPVTDDVFGAFWSDRGVPGKPSLLLGAAAVGLLAAIVLPFRDVGLGTFLVLLAAGGVVFAASRRRRERFTLLCAGLCVLLAATAVVRDAEWIVMLCLVTGAGLCVIGVTGGRTLLGFVISGIVWPLAGLRGLPWLGRTIAAFTGLGQGAALLRTVALSVVGLLVFGALFVSADALLGEWIDALLPDLTVGTFVLRAFIAVAVGGAVLAAAYLALNPARVDRAGRTASPVGRRFEWLVPVLAVNGAFAAFLIAQATAVFGGHEYLENTTGMTYADYVHQGFGQLTVATALTLLVIWAASRKASRESAADRAWLRGSLGLLGLQTLVVVASALYRMDAYEDAYGFTRLRLLVDVFEGWLGLLVIAAVVGQVVLRATWVPRFALVTGTVALLGLAAINPDAWIAEQNLDRYAETGKVDWYYLHQLSYDAVVVFDDQPEDVRACAMPGETDDDDDWLEWNLGRARAADAVAADDVAGSDSC